MPFLSRCLIIALTFTTATRIAAAPARNSCPRPSENPYFSKVQPIRWIDCASNVPDGVSEAMGFNGTTWPTSKDPLPSSLACGRLDVPVDYEQPFGSDNNMTIAFSLVKANKTSQGLLAYNPGGPTVEAQSTGWQTALDFSAGKPTQFSGLESQNLLFYDTRGIGGSNRLTCDVTLAQSKPPLLLSTKADFEAIKRWNSAFGQSCIDLTTPKGLIENMGTEEITRDWNALRIALGYKKINYAGISYGSYYGASLIHNFPEIQDRYVLDAVAAHGRTGLERIISDIKATYRLLERSDAWCMANSSCPFHKQGKGSVPKAFSEQVSNSPLNFSIQLRQQQHALMMVHPHFALFNEYLSQYIQAASTNFSSGLPSVPDALAQPAFGALDGLGTQAIICRDEALDTTTFDGFMKIVNETTAFDPLGLVQTTLNWALQLGCIGWPVPGRPKSKIAIETKLLLSTADYDLNTPTEETTAARESMPSAGLVVRHGDDHVSLDLIEQPAQKTAMGYLKTGKLPKSSTQQLQSIFEPGQARSAIPDPYEVPVGLAAADLDPVDADNN